MSFTEDTSTIAGLNKSSCSGRGRNREHSARTRLESPRLPPPLIASGPGPAASQSRSCKTASSLNGRGRQPNPMERRFSKKKKRKKKKEKEHHHRHTHENVCLLCGRWRTVMFTSHASGRRTKTGRLAKNGTLRSNVSSTLCDKRQHHHQIRIDFLFK